MARRSHVVQLYILVIVLFAIRFNLQTLQSLAPFDYASRLGKELPPDDTLVNDGIILSGESFPPATQGTIQQETSLKSRTTAQSPAHGATAKEEEAILLQEQVRLQNEFQTLLYHNQYPPNCQHRRLLLTHARKKPLDGFTLEFQDASRQLQVALSTDRTLIVLPTWKSAYANCDNSPTAATNRANTTAWTCLWMPITNCSHDVMATEGEQSPDNNNPIIIQGIHSSSRGIQNESSPFFNTRYHGSQRVLPGKYEIWKDLRSHVDHVPYWERLMGRFWVRSQLLHFLWRPSVTLQRAMQPRLPRSPMPFQQQPWMGMHIRLTDSQGTFLKDFSRNATITRSLDSYLAIATDIVQRYNLTTPVTIYVATDSSNVLKELKQKNTSLFEFIVQDDVQRSESTNFMWFESLRSLGAAAIAADVEVLKQASFLIGSYQSNVFRLATGLNQAFHVHRYNSRTMQRFFPVDIEWYEDP